MYIIIFLPFMNDYVAFIWIRCWIRLDLHEKVYLKTILVHSSCAKTPLRSNCSISATYVKTNLSLSS